MASSPPPPGPFLDGSAPALSYRAGASALSSLTSTSSGIDKSRGLQMQKKKRGLRDTEAVSYLLGLSIGSETDLSIASSSDPAAAVTTTPTTDVFSKNNQLPWGFFGGVSRREFRRARVSRLLGRGAAIAYHRIICSGPVFRWLLRWFASAVSTTCPTT